MMRIIRLYFLLFVNIVRCLSLSKAWNLVKLMCSFVLSRFFHVHAFWGMPASISVEPTNICNLRCPECPTGNQSSTAPKGHISLKTCSVLVPQIQSSVCFANLYFQGEPFLNKDILSIIQQFSDAHIFTAISSNAHFITSENAEDIVKSGLTKLIISLDGYDQTSYEQYRINGDFNKVLAGLQAISEAKQRLQSSLPIVELQCLLFKHTETHKEEVRHIGQRYRVDSIVFKTAQFYDTTHVDMLPSEKNSRYVMTDGNLKIKKQLKNSCWKMWCSCVVAWNGNVLPCCFDKNHIFALGNVHIHSLREIWQGKAYRNFKKMVHTHREKIEMCQNCVS